ncbi:MAG: ATP-NAD kinase family protein [Thermoleophilia bacterium]
MKKLGLIVNPIAGMGGRCGLKGTDGAEILAKAYALGAEPEAPSRAGLALSRLAALRDDLEILTVSGDMGEAEALEAGFRPTVLFTTNGGSTSGEDTRRAAREMAAAGVDLILFAGGDGTARDVYAAAGPDAVCLGVPAGCKIHSGVYGINPRNAGELAALYLQGKVTKVKQAEVMDIDEEAFRQGRVSAELFGYLTVPQDEARVQGGKAGRTQTDENALNAISYYLMDSLDADTLYILGTGGTVFGVKQRLGIAGTLLGVDVTRGRELVAADVTEQQLLELLDAEGGMRARIVVTVIGGQGYIFGRGNQQISPRVIERVGRDGIIVIATKQKIAALGGKPLLVDTGSEATNAMLTGYLRVVTGYNEQIAVRVSA